MIILIASAVKCVHYLPSHLSYVSTLPDIFAKKPKTYVVFLSTVSVGVRSDVSLPSRMSFHAWKSAGDCRRNASKSTTSFSAIPPDRITSKSWSIVPFGRPNYSIKFQWNRWLLLQQSCWQARTNKRTNRTRKHNPLQLSLLEVIKHTVSWDSYYNKSTHLRVILW